MQDAGYSAVVLQAAREIEQAEGEDMAARWWRDVVGPKCAQAREELAAVAAARPSSTHVVDATRWRRPARLPVLARAVPGFADLWRQEVPDEALERAVGDVLWVVCRCGGRHRLNVDVVTFCDETCGRWFLRLGDGSVRVKVWPRAVAA